MKRLLVIGSGEDFIDVVKRANEQSIYTVVCDPIKNGVAKKYSNKSYDIKLDDYKAIEEMIIEEKIDGIFSSFSDKTLKCYADMSKKFNMNCTLTPEMIPYLIDKGKMKDKLKQDGIPTAKYTYIKKDFNCEELNGLKFPLVMKPLISSGSKGIFVANNVEEIRKHIDETLSTCNDENAVVEKVLVEEFLEGEEVIISGWVANGNPYIQFINDRELYIKDKGRVGQGIRNVIPSKHLSYIEKDAAQLLKSVVKSFGFENGPCIIQTILHGNDLKVIEVLGRISGSNDHRIIEKIGGTNTVDLFLDYVLNGNKNEELVKDNERKKKKTCIYIPIILRAGKIGSIENLEKISELPYVTHIDNMKSVGEVVGNTGDMRAISGTIHIVADNLYMGYKYEKIVKEMLVIKDTDGNNMIDNFFVSQKMG